MLSKGDRYVSGANRIQLGSHIISELFIPHRHQIGELSQCHLSSIFCDVRTVQLEEKEEAEDEEENAGHPDAHEYLEHGASAIELSSILPVLAAEMREIGGAGFEN